MSRPFSSRGPAAPTVRINGKIRAREVRVVTADGRQVGILSLGEAINLARSQGMDLVEVAATANPPVCRIVDFGKFQYEQAKKEKESKKHQHSNRVKEIQLRPGIDAHDFEVKQNHAVDFLCEEMKVKVILRFRGREMRHKELGVQTLDRFIKELAPYGLAVEQPKLAGRSMGVMINPSRAPNAPAIRGSPPRRVSRRPRRPNCRPPARLPRHRPSAKPPPQNRLPPASPAARA
ncbi:MAG: translation initiation factor IF-3 [Verrucomicrobia bacterium]|nr:translation initiation factor IF-3 [Verrucomicrobiota bacterium]